MKDACGEAGEHGSDVGDEGSSESKVQENILYELVVQAIKCFRKIDCKHDSLFLCFAGVLDDTRRCEIILTYEAVFQESSLIR